MFGSPSPSIAAGVLAACLTLPHSSYAQAQAQMQAPKTETARGLSIEYADGHINTGPLRRSGGMWTSDFPRITGADPSRNGVRLTTLDVKHAIDGAEVVDRLAVLRRARAERRETAHMSSDAPEFRAWLRRTSSEYEEWLARLEAKP